MWWWLIDVVPFAVDVVLGVDGDGEDNDDEGDETIPPTVGDVVDEGVNGDVASSQDPLRVSSSTRPRLKRVMVGYTRLHTFSFNLLAMQNGTISGHDAVENNTDNVGNRSLLINMLNLTFK